MLVVVELLGVGGVARGPGVQVDHHVVVLAGTPERLVVLVGVAGQARLDRHGRQHDPPEDAGVAGPGDLLHGAVHVVEVDGDAGGPAPGSGSAELGQPAVVGVQGRPHHLEPLAGLAAQVHGRRQAAGEHRAREGHLGVDPLLLERGKTPPAGVGGEDPLAAVVGQPLGRRLGVDAHAGQTPGGHRPDRVGLVGLPGVDPAEHGDGHRREVTEGRHRLPVGRVDVGQEGVQIVGRGMGVGRDHHVGPPRAEPFCSPWCHPTRLPDAAAPRVHHVAPPQATSRSPRSRLVADYCRGPGRTVPARWARSAQSFDDGGVGLAAALAHGLEPVAGAGALHLVEQGGQQAGPRAAGGVADGDGARR